MGARSNKGHYSVGSGEVTDDTTSKMVDEATKKTLAQIPLLKTKAGPRDGEEWVQRLKEEYQSLISVRLRIKKLFVQFTTFACPYCSEKGNENWPLSSP